LGGIQVIESIQIIGEPPKQMINYAIKEKEVSDK
jgi:hypothetical protein